MAPTGEPRPSPKPQPLGNFAVILLSTTCTLCLIFVLWRRADSLRSVVSHKLRTWTRREGTIRLSIDDGPPATEFLAVDDDESVDGDEEPLANRAQQLKSGLSTVANKTAQPPQTSPVIS
jgi:hypothetical protein